MSLYRSNKSNQPTKMYTRAERKRVPTTSECRSQREATTPTPTAAAAAAHFSLIPMIALKPYFSALTIPKQNENTKKKQQN